MRDTTVSTTSTNISRYIVIYYFKYLFLLTESIPANSSYPYRRLEIRYVFTWSIRILEGVKDWAIQTFLSIAYVFPQILFTWLVHESWLLKIIPKFLAHCSNAIFRNRKAFTYVRIMLPRLTLLRLALKLIWTYPLR